MQSIQIDGTFTYAENVLTLKLGDMIRLAKNPNNHVNSKAVGAYIVKSGKKIGYVPFKANQIDINAKYKVTKILRGQVLISREWEVTNIIPTQPIILKQKLEKINQKIRNQDLKEFSKFLEKSGIPVLDCVITWQDDNFINLIILTPDGVNKFYTVTRKYYEEHVFEYDELFNFKLIPRSIYQPFQIHRIETYIEKNYKSAKKIKIPKMSVMNNIEKIKCEPLKEIEYEDFNILKLAIQYFLSGNQNEYYNPEIFGEKKLESKNLVIPEFLDKCKLGGISYNHTMKAYCYIDLYNDDSIIEIIDNVEPDIDSIVIKAIISCKKSVILYNPIKGIIYRINIPSSE